MVEILLFMSHHRAHIVSSLITSLNAAYVRFMRRNPRFKVSCLGAIPAILPIND